MEDYRSRKIIKRAVQTPPRQSLNNKMGSRSHSFYYSGSAAAGTPSWRSSWEPRGAKNGHQAKTHATVEVYHDFSEDSHLRISIHHPNTDFGGNSK